MYVQTTDINPKTLSELRTGSTPQEDRGSPGAFLPLAGILVFGTLGQVTPELLANRSGTSAWIHFFNAQSPSNWPAAASTLLRAPAEDLAIIRQTLKPTMLEIARVFGVSRQAVYGWLNGAQPDQLIASRLASLARVGETLLGSGVAVDSAALRRRSSHGGTVLEMLLTASDPELVASDLQHMLSRESVQRERLSGILSGRRRGSNDLSDYGSPALREDQ